MTEHVDDRALLIQLHGVLSEIDPVRWRDEAAVALRSRLTELRRHLAQRERLATLAGELQVNLDQLDSRGTDLQARWLDFKKRVQPAYEAIAAGFRAQKIHVPSLRPTNWARSALHVGTAALAVAAIELMPPTVLIAFAALWVVFVWGCEIGRRNSTRINVILMKIFKPVAHVHEKYRINSATWYATALLLLALTRNSAVELAAVGILGIGDPMAGLIGRKFGRIKLVHGRSLEGTLSFFVSAVAVAFGLLLVFAHSLSTGEALVIAIIASLFGALAELFSLRLDDNISVPLAAAAGAILVLQFF